MRSDLLHLASDLAKRGEPFALATVVRREPPSSARVGDTTLVTYSGVSHGWLGGSCTQPTVVREALAALNDRLPRLIALSSTPEADHRPGVVAFAMECHSGGSVDIYIEPVLPAPRLVVFGASLVGQALVRLGKALGYAVDAVDPSADAATFPEADRLFTTYEALALESPSGSLGPWRGAVVATMGQSDEDGVRAALGLAPAYLGVVASRKRYAEVRETLQAEGTAESLLRGIWNPAGLDIGAERPEEIALSVLAQIVGVRNSPVAEPAPAPIVAAGALEKALDPVCGMSVTIANARYQAELGGRTWYFCGAGCRDRFLSEPHRYGAAEPAGAAGVSEAIRHVQEAMEAQGYIAEPAIAMAVYLAREMRKPLLIEGDAGVGKTEIAKVMARMLHTELIRLQCYQGLDVNTALYEWNYQRQILHLKIAERDGRDGAALEAEIFGRDFLLERPLLRAITRSDGPPVLLIDEVDRADDGFEAFLLEVLSDFQVTIPELGTIQAAHEPYVVLTSNNSREIGDALRRRCLYLYVEHPSFEKEVRIIRTRVPAVSKQLADQIARFAQSLRTRRLAKVPGVAETLDWARALVHLHRDHLDVDVVQDTLGCLIKDRHDLDALRPSETAALVAAVQDAARAS